jgi:uncharacterized membrane protein YdbT with pleckstrin-like domain
MAIVACPECKGQVSSAAAACPHCGHPLAPSAAADVPRSPPPRSAAAREETLWEARPSIKSLTVTITSTVVFGVVMTVAMALSYRPALRFIAGISDGLAKTVAQSESSLRLAAVLLVVGVVGARAVKVAWKIIALRSQRYRLSNQRLLLETGVLSKTITEIDLRTVDEIVFQQTPLERLLGLGEIGVISSEPGGRGIRARVRLAGVIDPRAVREQIRPAAYEATGNQLFMRST